jgi:putative addiction module component (TIGR02574 family)
MDMPAIKEIEQAVLALPVEQRAHLAESLLKSLPPVGDTWSEAEELAEVERREREIESGTVQPLSEADFWKRVEANRKR